MIGNCKQVQGSVLIKTKTAQFSDRQLQSYNESLRQKLLCSKRFRTCSHYSVSWLLENILSLQFLGHMEKDKSSLSQKTLICLSLAIELYKKCRECPVSWH